MAVQCVYVIKVPLWGLLFCLYRTPFCKYMLHESSVSWVTRRDFLEFEESIIKRRSSLKVHRKNKPQNGIHEVDTPGTTISNLTRCTTTQERKKMFNIFFTLTLRQSDIFVVAKSGTTRRPLEGQVLMAQREVYRKPGCKTPSLYVIIYWKGIIIG